MGTTHRTAFAAFMIILVAASAAQAQTTVTAVWDRNSDDTTVGYRLYYGTTPGSYPWSIDVGNEVSAPLTLTAGTRYYAAVRAYNVTYEYGPASAEVSIDLTAPAPPTAQISATLQANNAVLVTWSTTNAASATINGAPVAASGSTTTTVSASTTFTLVATSATGITATASATVTIAAPAAPTAQISATLQANNAVLVTWATTNAARATINGAPVAASGSTTVTVSATTTFTLVATSATGVTATASATVTLTAPASPTGQISATLQANNAVLVTWATTNAASAAINGAPVAASGSTTVTVSATTTFTLVATSATGVTATASATVTLNTSTVPSAPVSLTGSVSGNRVSLGWQPPTGGAAPETYLVYVGTSAGAINVLNGFSVGNVLGASGDLPRGRYYIRVRAANAHGTSVASNEISLRVGRRLATPGGFSVTWSGTTATLTWTASSADAAEDVPNTYVLEAGSTPGASDVATVRVGNTTSFSADVSSGTYYVRLHASNEYGDSDPTADLVLVAPGAPLAPSGLIATGVGPNVELRWTAPRGGFAPTGYVVEAGTAPGLADLGTIPLGNVLRFSTVAPPGVYYVRVRGTNARGAGVASNEIIVRR